MLISWSDAEFGHIGAESRNRTRNLALFLFFVIVLQFGYPVTFYGSLWTAMYMVLYGGVIYFGIAIVRDDRRRMIPVMALALSSSASGRGSRLHRIDPQRLAAFEIGNPGSFTDPRVGGSPRWQQLLYFSYVTMATLGYGEIVPITAWARSMASLEAVVGTLFLTIVIARLVGVWTGTQRWATRPRGSGNAMVIGARLCSIDRQRALMTIASVSMPALRLPCGDA